MRNLELWKYSDNIFHSNPVAPGIPSSPAGQKTVGERPSAFYGLDFMVHKAFRRIDCQNIQQVYEFRNSLQEINWQGGVLWVRTDM